ncbi:hypothetical protein MIMGU_mgv1a0209252mg, partial [Erythranthe guttata]
GRIDVNKLIGARNFASYFPGPTAAGNFVSGANVFGQANGTASGIAPLTHLAIYKVATYWQEWMWLSRTYRVDVLSLALAGDNVSHTSPFHENVVAVGAFSAVKRGIFVSCSAGNDGPRRFVVVQHLAVDSHGWCQHYRQEDKSNRAARKRSESFYQPEEGGSS